MCGICGAKGPHLNDAVFKMTQAIVHRGPDSNGFYTDDHCSLGMRRLKIIDLEGSEQPIFNEDRSLVLIFNGEIYNFRDLRNDLERGGHQFATSGDGEVIIHLYEQYRSDCVLKLRGMFAFAIWDIQRRQIFIARDRLGIKPLYYAKLPGKFLFASEIKALMASGEIPIQLDDEGILRFAGYPAIPAPLTIFQTIQTLPPGHTLLSDASGTYIQEYWDIDVVRSSQNLIPREEAADELKKALFEAVRIRLISDVPLGAFLSGGIDSSAVVAIMSELLDRPVRTFSIKFTGKGKEFEWFDDASFAQKVAEYYGTEHTEEVITGREVYDNLLDAVWSMDQPSGDALQYYLVSKSARKEVTVALSGTGGDEVFAGYEWFKELRNRNHLHERLNPILSRLSTPILGILDGLRNEAMLPKWLRIIENFLLSHGSFESLFLINRRLYRNQDWFYIFSNEFISKIIDFSLDIDPVIHRLASRCERLNPVTQTSYLLLKADMPNLLLRDQDAVSMAHSLEVRFPLIDQMVVECAARIAPDLKLNGDTEKFILREALKGMLPNEILQRTKKGFLFPMGNWMRNELKPVVLSCLSKESVKKRGIFNVDMTTQLLTDFYNGKEPFFKVWNQAVFELWCRVVVDTPNGWQRPSGKLEDYL